MGIEGAKRTLAPHAGDAVDRVAQRHPWETLSALSAVPFTKDRLVSVTDSVYSPTRILSLSVPSTPAKITSQLTVTKDGRPVGYDAEGLVARQTGGYWLAVEGSTSKPDLLVRLDARGQVQQEVPLPADVAAAVITNGYEGVAEVAVDHDTFAVIERDNQRGPQASIKKIYAFDVPATWTGVPTVQRRLVKDLLPALRADHGWVQDKVEGLAAAGNGQTYAVTDNDAIDDSTGETVFLRLGRLL